MSGCFFFKKKMLCPFTSSYPNLLYAKTHVTISMLQIDPIFSKLVIKKAKLKAKVRQMAVLCVLHHTGGLLLIMRNI